MKRSVVFDSGAVIAAERNNPRVWAILNAAYESRSAVVMPATVIAETWRGPRTHPLAAKFLASMNQFPTLDASAAKRTGALLVGGGSITDANVVDVAIRAAPAVVVTSDPHDIRALLRTAASSADVQIQNL
jgi:hypothetical protein